MFKFLSSKNSYLPIHLVHTIKTKNMIFVLIYNKQKGVLWNL